jgi:hypothetical protein
MSKYNKFYFLHIPKTGGRFFTRYITNQIEDTLKQNGVEIIKPPDNALKHGGWHKDIDDNTYIVSVFRDPAEFFVSAVAHMHAQQNGLIDDNNDFIIKNNSKVLEISVDSLHEKLQQLKYLKNFQSQNFILSPTGNPILKESMNYCVEGKTFDNDLIYERIKRVNLMIRHNELKYMDYQLLINKISNDLGIEIDIDISSLDREHYKNNSSEVLFNKLSKDDLELVYNNFLFDKEIFQNDSLFWNKKI